MNEHEFKQLPYTSKSNLVVSSYYTNLLIIDERESL
jgi:hypothetical protein